MSRGSAGAAPCGHWFGTSPRRSTTSTSLRPVRGRGRRSRGRGPCVPVGPVSPGRGGAAWEASLGYGARREHRGGPDPRPRPTAGVGALARVRRRPGRRSAAHPRGGPGRFRRARLPRHLDPRRRRRLRAVGAGRLPPLPVQAGDPARAHGRDHGRAARSVRGGAARRGRRPRVPLRLPGGVVRAVPHVPPPAGLRRLERDPQPRGGQPSGVRRPARRGATPPRGGRRRGGRGRRLQCRASRRGGARDLLAVRGGGVVVPPRRAAHPPTSWSSATWCSRGGWLAHRPDAVASCLPSE